MISYWYKSIDILDLYTDEKYVVFFGLNPSR